MPWRKSNIFSLHWCHQKAGTKTYGLQVSWLIDDALQPSSTLSVTFLPVIIISFQIPVKLSSAPLPPWLQHRFTLSQTSLLVPLVLIIGPPWTRHRIIGRIKFSEGSISRKPKIKWHTILTAIHTFLMKQYHNTQAFNHALKIKTFYLTYIVSI